MFRNRDNQPKSPYPISNPIQSTETYEGFLERLQALFAGDDAEAFFEAIENAPARWQRKPELMLTKAVGYLRSGEEDEALKIFADIERTHPKFAPIYFYRATIYMAKAYPAHALRMLAKVHALGRMDDEAEGAMQEMETVARSLISETAQVLNVPVERMEKASGYHENAQEKLAAGQWVAAEQMTREALKVIPHWSSPRNNRSYVLYFLGRVDEAMAEANAVLAGDPDNLHTLKNMVIFNAGLGRDEAAREFSRRMAAHLKTLPPDSDEVDMIILVLGLVNDDETLWSLAQTYLKRDAQDLLDQSWYALAVSAIRTEHLKQAKTLLEKVEQFYEPAAKLALEVRKALKAGKPIIVKPVQVGAALLLPEAVIEELIALVGIDKASERAQRQAQKKMEEYVRKRPFIVNGLFHLLLAPDSTDMVAPLLLTLNQSEVDKRLLEIGLGQVGTNQQRLQILSAMLQMEREVPPSPIRFWNDEQGEWIETDLIGQMISDDIELNISPKAGVWAKKAHEAKDVEEQIAFWRKAVETDPKSGYAVHMLGIMLIKNGRKEEGGQLARRAIEVDPDYMFAYANLALMEVQKEDPDQDVVDGYLKKVMKARVISSQTAFIAHYASMLLAIQRDDFTSARKEFDIAKEIRPDDPMLSDWDERLRRAEVFSGGWLADWHKQGRERAHKKAIQTPLEPDSDSRVTLNSLTSDILSSMMKLWGVPGYGKKAEKIEFLIRVMQDASVFNGMVVELKPPEKEALQWVLAQGGFCAWETFIEKYGSDAEESPYWQYHEPETVIGRLRHIGFLAKGTVNDQQGLFIPADLRHNLKTNLEQ